MNISLRDLLEAGVHYGHQTRRWNPRMKPYIYGAKNGIHVIDLQKTARGLVEATRFLQATAGNGGNVLFVGTKRSARNIIMEEAARCGGNWVNHRWLGGTMTNWGTVKKSIDRLNALERARDEGRFDLLSKKEALTLSRDIERMDRNLGGIKTMKGLPAALFIVDPKREHLAVAEARALNIPIVALCDTNCDPQGITHVIPGNDDALKSIRLFTGAVADAFIEGRQGARRQSGTYVSDDAEAGAEDVAVVQKRAAADAAPAAEAAPAVAPVAEPAPPATEGDAAKA
ncbi:MAG: 30S ribosomal protein S2 [Myxococcota bacterium]